MWCSRRWSRAYVLVCAAMLGGCSSSENTGVLGNGQFRYVCTSGEGDIACSGASDTDLQMYAFAVGATFQLSYAPNSSAGGTIQGSNGFDIVAASPELASTTGDTIRALRPGFVALLAEHVGKADVDDFVHLQLSPIAKLRPNPNEPSITLSVGQSQVVTLEALDPNMAPLAGQIPCQWLVTSGPDSVTIDNSNAAGRSASVRAVAGGSAIVHATCVDATVDVSVTVLGPGPSDGGTNG